jgi:hypothetical protein
MNNTPRLVPNLIAAAIAAIVAIGAIVMAPAPVSSGAWVGPLAALCGLAISALAGWLGLTFAAPEEDPDDLD